MLPPPFAPPTAKLLSKAADAALDAAALDHLAANTTTAGPLRSPEIAACELRNFDGERPNTLVSTRPNAWAVWLVFLLWPSSCAGKRRLLAAIRGCWLMLSGC